jgi:hypothetical protein
LELIEGCHSSCCEAAGICGGDCDYVGNLILLGFRGERERASVEKRGELEKEEERERDCCRGKTVEGPPTIYCCLTFFVNVSHCEHSYIPLLTSGMMIQSMAEIHSRGNSMQADIYT